MKDPETSTVFAGVDGRTDTELPEWYRQKKTVDDPESFAEAVRDLPQAVETTVAYQNPYTDEWVETERFNALVEPGRARDQATESEPETDPLFHVPTDSYSIINPVDVYQPLEDVLREETIEDTSLGDVMFGEIRRYRGGGEVHMDVMFDGLEVRLPGRSDPITMGVTSGYDFFGEHAVYVEGFAQDGYCSNSMRSLTDKEVIKHVGDVRDFRTWWEEILAQVELVADDLFEFIRDAQEIDLEFSELPFTVTEFYSLLGFPDYLAERAAEDAEANAASPFAIDMWTLHSGATYALTHFFQGKEGTSLDQYVRVANDILFNPEGTIERVERAYEEQLEADGDDGSQASLAGERALASIERVNEDLQANVEQFEAREEALRERFQQVTN
ncbi:hypothetical protein DVK05_15660 [Halorubrum sp. Atlit-8R]|jgi:hypothetical protein|uniref:Uncharacterized protein n=1 Tax=Haloplanus vescus TaxID=555874 RepID=A0A1H4ADP2_9EURY|nr:MULTISPECIES: hypothetical protein [Haloferacales]RLM76784.1 hypothetical protein DVK05_15660 [Halorubrum sp. Atlit-8R]SEA33634.1 hypothetical protein SAMN04488065_2733 [Haloplanus vescus]